jgi:guanylate kinase
MYKIIIIAASTGGKSTLMRYLRKHTDLVIAEMDEELVKINNGKWPFDDRYKNSVLVPKVTNKIIKSDKVVYLSSYVPDELAQKAKDNGFTIVLLDVSLEQLKQRDAIRIAEESYESVSRYFDMQLKGFERLKKKGLIDKTIDGHQSTKEIAEEIVRLAKKT